MTHPKRHTPPKPRASRQSARHRDTRHAQQNTPPTTPHGTAHRTRTPPIPTAHRMHANHNGTAHWAPRDRTLSPATARDRETKSDEQDPPRPPLQNRNPSLRIREQNPSHVQENLVLSKLLSQVGRATSSHFFLVSRAPCNPCRVDLKGTVAAVLTQVEIQKVEVCLGIGM